MRLQIYFLVLVSLILNYIPTIETKKHPGDSLPTTSPISIDFSPTELPTKHSITTTPTEAPTKHGIESSPTETPTKHGITPTNFPTNHGMKSSPTEAPTGHGSSSPTESPTKKEEGSYLWDLLVDPTETNNLYLKSSYKTIRDHMKARMSYWQDALLPTDDDNSRTDDKAWASAYEECGGVCPYVNDTYSLDIEQIYFPENPPHIVYVLVDDWGYNDIGLRSTYMNWTTPTIDKLVGQGVLLENYFAHSFCVPTRAALLTGRFAGRLGLLDDLDGEMSLPVSEVTLAQELKSAGYETHLVGKWDLGHSSQSRLPTYRGFDSFYGYYSGFIDYYSKTYGVYLDLQDNDELVTSEKELSSSYHSAYLFQKKAEAVILNHAAKEPTTPLFLYYAMQLVHAPYEAPLAYLERCAGLTNNLQNEDDSVEDYTNYCALNLMLDEVIANLTCVLKEANMLSNTVFILASDNGGAAEIPGASYPYRGHKYDFNRGGLSVTAFVASDLIPEDRRGGTYSGQMHVSDWLPTIMGLATEGEWAGGYTDAVIDGVDMWDAIVYNATSPRTEIAHYANTRGQGSLQFNMIKYDMKLNPADVDDVEVYFSEDYAPDLASFKCGNPSIVVPVAPTDSPTPVSNPVKVGSPKPTHWPTKYPTDEPTRAPSPVSNPVKVGSSRPTNQPTHWPTKLPSEFPTHWPTHWPTKLPSEVPTHWPTHWPTKLPTDEPTERPTHWPTHWPTKFPTDEPTKAPVHKPSYQPTPIHKPSYQPTTPPTYLATHRPSTGSPVFPSNADQTDIKKSPVATLPTRKPTSDSAAARSHSRNSNSRIRHRSSSTSSSLSSSSSSSSSSSTSSSRSSSKSSSRESSSQETHHNHRSLSSAHQDVRTEGRSEFQAPAHQPTLTVRIQAIVFEHPWALPCALGIAVAAMLAAVLVHQQVKAARVIEH